MLSRLRITDFVLIDALDLSFESGFTIVTGETGAGKSILVEALSLLAGGRASSGVVRSGANEAVVEAIFEHDGEEIAVRRTVEASGRSKVTLNGSVATVAMLSGALRPHISIAGQHEHQRLLVEANQLDWLDRFAGDSNAGTAVAVAHRRVGEARAVLEEIRAVAENREERAAWLRHVAGEIDGARLRLGEDDDLALWRVRAKHGAELARAVAQADEALYSGEGAAVGKLHVAGAELARVGSRVDARFADWAARLGEAEADVDAIAAEIRAFAAKIESEPQSLDEIEARLDQLEKIKRKHGGSIEAALATAERARAELATIEDVDANLARAMAALAEAEEERKAACAALSRARTRAAKALSRRVERGLTEVGMSGAIFEVRLAALATPGPSGAEGASFAFSANRGEPARPLAQIASGGELSRVHLSLCEALAERAPANCTLFDEIDAGIGGAAADAVGRKLLAAGARGQVIAITHLAQIAALANHHVVVSKRDSAGRTVAEVRRLSVDERAHEIARMLAGATVSERAVAHARELMVGADQGSARTKGMTGAA